MVRDSQIITNAYLKKMNPYDDEQLQGYDENEYDDEYFEDDDNYM